MCRFLVLNDNTSIPVYSTTSGDIASTLAVPPTSRPSLITCDAFAFSPDTSEIAAFSWISGKRFTCWNNRGTIVFDLPIPESWYRIPKHGMPVHWLADGSGWMLGSQLLHRETRVPVWRLDRKLGFPSETRLINQNWVLVQHQPSSQDETLRAVRIPWERINGVIEDCRTGKGIILPSTEPVRLDVRCELASNETASPELLEFLRTNLQQHLEADGYQVTGSAETTIRMTYAETPSDKFGEQNRDSVRAVRYGFDFVRGDITAHALTIDDGETISFIDDSDRQQALNARRQAFAKCRRKLRIPSAASSDVKRGTLPIVYFSDL